MAHVAGKRLCLALAAVSVAAVTAFLLLFPSDSEELVILMYHHVADVGDDSVTLSAEKLESDIRTAIRLGYTFVSVSDVIDFVDGGARLPERAVMLIFDDGYRSVGTLAMPILEKYRVKAAVSIIGSTVGMSPGRISHLTWEEAAKMEATGLVTVISHTYDMHGIGGGGASRAVAARLPGESEAAFAAAFHADHRQMTALMRARLGHPPTAFAYPHGIPDPAADRILADTGVRMTFTTEAGVNILKRGDPACLRLMKRYNVNESVNIAEILCGSSDQRDE